MNSPLFAEGSIVSLCILRVEWLQPRAGFVSWLFLVWLGDLVGSLGWGPELSRGNGQYRADFLSSSCQVPSAGPDLITVIERVILQLKASIVHVLHSTHTTETLGLLEAVAS